jgi:hypothetical protein
MHGSDSADSNPRHACPRRCQVMQYSAYIHMHCPLSTRASYPPMYLWSSHRLLVQSAQPPKSQSNVGPERVSLTQEPGTNRHHAHMIVEVILKLDRCDSSVRLSTLFYFPALTLFLPNLVLRQQNGRPTNVEKMAVRACGRGRRYRGGVRTGRAWGTLHGPS